MKIIHKLTIGSVAIILLLAIAGHVAVSMSERALRDNIAPVASRAATEAIDAVDADFRSKVELLEVLARTCAVQNAMTRSNREFEQRGGIEARVEARDREWRSAAPDTITPFMKELMGSHAAEHLKGTVQYFSDRQGYPVIGEIFVTNRYGANVAQSGRTTDYRQDDEAWWQKAKEERVYVGDVAFDESAGIYSTDVGLRIENDKGEFLGVMKAVLNLKRQINVVKRALPRGLVGRYAPVSLRLLSPKLQVLYAAGADTSSETDFAILDEAAEGESRHRRTGTFVRHDPERGDLLCAYARSQGHADPDGLGWTLLLEYRTDDIYGSITRLKRRIWTTTLCLAAVGLALGFGISRSVSRRLYRLQAGVQAIGDGDLDYRLASHSRDEIGEVSRAFDRMASHLKATTASRDELAEEARRRAQAEKEHELIMARQVRINQLQASLLGPDRLAEKLKKITDTAVEVFGADFCRIWMTHPGDRCESGCIHAEVTEGPHVCVHRDRCLHLMASSGRYTHIDGEVHRRVPFGCYKIGRVAADMDPKFLTNDVVHDPRVHHHDWARELGLVSFAGYQLRPPGGETLGVLALFAQHAISPDEDAMLESVSNTVAQVIQAGWAEQDVKQAKDAAEEANTGLETANAQLQETVAQANQMALEARVAHTELKQIFDSASDGILVIDKESNVLRANKTFGDIVGMDPDDAQGKKCYDMLKHSICRTPDCPLRQIKRGKSRIEFDFELDREDGSHIFCLETAVRFRGIAGELIGILCTIKDITHRKVMETQLSHAQKLESIGQLAAGIAHEINTPTQYVGDNTRFLQEGFGDLMQVIEKYGELLGAAKNGGALPELVAEVEALAEEMELEYLREEVPNAIEQSLEGVARVAKIVRAMKEFSHPGRDEKTRIDLNRAIETTITVARNEWKYVAEMETDFDEAVTGVPCYPGDLNQVILNIIVNAAHAITDVVGDNSGEKGRITVSTRRDADWAEIRILDTGPGIPEEIRSRVFDPFFTTKGVGKGTGQGLAIAYSIITEKHGGSLTFESETGKGTTFVIRLPCGDPDRGAVSTDAASTTQEGQS